MQIIEKEMCVSTKISPLRRRAIINPNQALDVLEISFPDYYSRLSPPLQRKAL